MFTGIVKGIGKIEAIEKREQLHTLVISFPQDMADGIETGASVAINGCCLTVTMIEGHQVSFDVMQETLKVTNLVFLDEGYTVNLERAARFGDEIGGHQVSGHIFCVAEILEVIQTDTNCTMWFSLPPKAAPYIFPKGYIAIDGTSLTIGEVQRDKFCVYLIPETLERTIINQCLPGYFANIEIDTQTQTIVDTVERIINKEKRGQVR